MGNKYCNCPQCDPLEVRVKDAEIAALKDKLGAAEGTIENALSLLKKEFDYMEFMLQKIRGR